MKVIIRLFGIIKALRFLGGYRAIRSIFQGYLRDNLVNLDSKEQIHMTKHKDDYASFLASKSSFEGFSPMLKALWYDGNGDWDGAHEQVDSLEGKDAARVHAYLHRKEGDQWNADYWYRRAGEKMPQISLEEEWRDLLLRYWR